MFIFFSVVKHQNAVGCGDLHSFSDGFPSGLVLFTTSY